MKFFQYYDENHAVRLGFCRGELLADAQASVQKSGDESAVHVLSERTDISGIPAGTPDPVQSRFHPYAPYSLSQCR